MKLPRLMAITDWSLANAREQLEDLVTLGPSVAIQHRDPTAPIRLFLERAHWLSGLCQRTGTPLFINGRLDVALRVDAHLHLPEDAPSPEEIRPFLAKGKWISAAVHKDMGRASGADLALVSPVFAPGSKKEPSYSARPLGPEGFFEFAQRLPCPAYALGGITQDTVASVRNAAGIAVVSAVFSERSASEAARRLLAELGV